MVFETHTGALLFCASGGLGRRRFPPALASSLVAPQCRHHSAPFGAGLRRSYRSTGRAVPQPRQGRSVQSAPPLFARGSRQVSLLPPRPHPACPSPFTARLPSSLRSLVLWSLAHLRAHPPRLPCAALSSVVPPRCPLRHRCEFAVVLLTANSHSSAVRAPGAVDVGLRSLYERGCPTTVHSACGLAG